MDWLSQSYFSRLAVHTPYLVQSTFSITSSLGFVVSVSPTSKSTGTRTLGHGHGLTSSRPRETGTLVGAVAASVTGFCPPSRSHPLSVFRVVLWGPLKARITPRRPPALRRSLRFFTACPFPFSLGLPSFSRLSPHRPLFFFSSSIGSRVFVSAKAGPVIRGVSFFSPSLSLISGGHSLEFWSTECFRCDVDELHHGSTRHSRCGRPRGALGW